MSLLYILLSYNIYTYTSACVCNNNNFIIIRHSSYIYDYCVRGARDVLNFCSPEIYGLMTFGAVGPEYGCP